MRKIDIILRNSSNSVLYAITAIVPEGDSESDRITDTLQLMFGDGVCILPGDTLSFVERD